MALFRFASTLLAVFAAVTAWPSMAAVDAGHQPPTAEVQALLDRLDRAQGMVHTMRAELVATRGGATGPAETLTGELTYARPNRVRWEYTRPEERVYVLDKGQISGWLPAKNEFEQLDVSRYEGRLLRILGLGQNSRALLREYVVSAGATPEELVLVPRSRRVRKQLAEVRMTLDPNTDLPAKIAFTAADGGRSTIELHAVQVNPPLAPDAFLLPVPRGARVVRGMSSLGMVPGGGLDDDN